MRIAYCLCSRGRYRELAAVITAAWNLRSRRHDVRFFVACEYDYSEYDDLIGWLRSSDDRPEIILVHHPEPMGSNVGLNRSVDATRSFDPDIATLMTNRALPASPHWDAALASAIIANPLRVVWWTSSMCDNTTFAVLPRSQLQACDWRPFPEIFPYWWGDTTVREIDMFISGKMPVWADAARYLFFLHETGGIREPAFWARVFAATRPKRIEQAAAIAERLGIKGYAGPSGDMIRRCEETDKWFAANADRIAANCGGLATGEPPPYYIRMRADAAKLFPADDLLQAAES